MLSLIESNQSVALRMLCWFPHVTKSNCSDVSEIVDTDNGHWSSLPTVTRGRYGYNPPGRLPPPRDSHPWRNRGVAAKGVYSRVALVDPISDIASRVT